MTLVSRTYWGGMPFRFKRPPAGASAEPRVLRTADFRDVPALWWTAGRPTVAVVAMHPRVDFTRHYLFPRLLAAGIGCLGAISRCEGDDTDCVHEELLHDLTACVTWLREHRGIRHVVLLGNSGGGSLAAYWLAEGGTAEGLVLVAAHRGEGQVLLQAIDPLDLDMYDPANGFRPPPAWTEYDPAFVARYRAAQRARVERLDAEARALLGDPEAILVVRRTMANPHYVDRTLDPSPRSYGSLISDRPDLMNRQRLGFARTVTPRAWLSTWSALSSKADLVRNLPRVTNPTLVVHAARDREIFPRTDHAPISAAVGAEDRTVLTMDARHYFEPEDPFSKERPDTEALMDVVVPWILDRFA